MHVRRSGTDGLAELDSSEMPWSQLSTKCTMIRLRVPYATTDKVADTAEDLGYNLERYSGIFNHGLVLTDLLTELGTSK